MIAARASETTFEARSLIGISSSRIAGGISGRTSRMRRSSVGRNMVCASAGRENNTSMRFLIRLLVNAAALWVATRLVSGREL